MYMTFRSVDPVKAFYWPPSCARGAGTSVALDTGLGAPSRSKNTTPESHAATIVRISAFAGNIMLEPRRLGDRAKRQTRERIISQGNEVCSVL
jgi:hypothetical protein